MSSNYAEACTAKLSALGQCLVELQPSNTKALLSGASQRIQERRAVAEAILVRLRKLNPDIASRFTLKEDALSQLRLRLITTPTTIGEQKPPTTFSSFIIVSYCWHSPCWKPVPSAKPVLVGWEVSKPFVDTIMSMRQGPDEGVWLDKMCINQDDDEDKRVHISTMDVIYRSARRLIILLEDVQLTAEEEAAAITYVAFYADMVREAGERGLQGEDRACFMDTYFPSREKAGSPLSSHDENYLRTLRRGAYDFSFKMLGARWFSRAWCAHEIRVVPHASVNNPLFFCYAADGRVLDFEHRFVHYLAMYIKEDTVGGPGPSTLVGEALREALHDPKPKTLVQMWWRMTLLIPEARGVEVTSALQHVISALRADCSQKGDLVSIALNTASVPLAFSGAGGVVSTVEDVVWIFTILVIAGDDVTPLFVLGGKFGRKLRVPLRPGEDDGVAGKTRISWAVRPGVGFFEGRTPSPRIDTITAATRDYIELDLVVFESRPSTPTVASFEVATRMMEDFSLADLAAVLLAADSEAVQRLSGLVSSIHEAVGGAKDDDLGSPKKFISMWLAHAMDCGLEWTLRFPDVIKAQTEDWEAHGTIDDASDERLADAARFLYHHFITTTPSITDRNSESDIQTLKKFLTAVLDPQMALRTAIPRRLPLGNGDFAMTSVTSNRAWIAVPAAITHVPAWHNLAWIIEPFDPSSEPLDEGPRVHLPDMDMPLKGDECAEDVFPLLSSDYADQRRARWREAGGAWRLRQQDGILGCQPLTGNEGAVVYLERQRVYGAEDYNWGGAKMAAVEIEKKHGPRPSSLALAEYERKHGRKYYAEAQPSEVQTDSTL